MYKASRQFQQLRLAMNKKFKNIAEASDTSESESPMKERAKTAATSRRNMSTATSKPDIKTIGILSSPKTAKAE